jgi:hypothetical protein
LRFHHLLIIQDRLLMLLKSKLETIHIVLFLNFEICTI